MGASPNPLSSLLGPMLNKLSAGASGGGADAGGGGDQGGGVPGEGQGDPGSQINSMSSELQGADPAFLLRTLQSIKAGLMAVFVQSGMRLPNVSGAVSQTIKQLDRAIKEAQQAQSTAQATQRPGIGFSAAQGAPAGSGPQASPGGLSAGT